MYKTNKMPTLQEKSASGSVASFNTALAMPLASCNIAVNAWQEGSGDPSPSNVRAIHGFSEVNLTANNVVRTIQLGQEVYGAEVDVVNGVAHCTHRMIDMGTRNLTYFEPSAPTYPYGYFRLLPTDKAYGVANLMCEYYKTTLQAVFTNDFTIMGSRTYYTCYIIDSQHTGDDLVNDKAPWLSGYKLVYPLAEPFDIQLTPTQIETLIGNNTIFADTGDIDLTYKDLDIAKRGNFREVFKLPS